MSKITLENVISMSKQVEDLKYDHVSKKALREWCENMKKASDTHVSLSSIAVSAVLAGVIDQFCKD